MTLRLVLACAVAFSVSPGAMGQYATPQVDVWVAEGKVYFQVIGDNTGSQVLFNETCYLNSKDPGDRTYYSGSTGINFVVCLQTVPYEVFLEAGTFETKIDLFDVPFEGTPPFTPHYYMRESAQTITVPPWLKITPGGWTHTEIALKNGTASIGAFITTSRGCAGEAAVGGAYNKPVGLQTDTFPSVSVAGNVSAQSVTYFNLGSLVTSQGNTVSGTVSASVQLQSAPCGYLKDPMFESNLKIASQ